MILTRLWLFSHFHTVYTGKLEDEIRNALDGIAFSPPAPPNLANSPSVAYPLAKYIRVSFCNRVQAPLVHEAALDVTDATTVTIEKLQALKDYVSKLPRDTAEWAAGGLESTMRHYRTFIDNGFWVPDTLEPAVKGKFERKLHTLNTVISTATAMKSEMLKDTPLVEVTCGYDWLSKKGVDISIGGNGAFQHHQNWYYDRRHSVALPRKDLKRWIEFVGYKGYVEGLDNYVEGNKVKIPLRATIVLQNLPPLVEVLSLSNYMWRNWTTSETLRNLRRTRYYRLQKKSLSTIIQPNLATALLGIFTRSPQMTGPAGPFEPGGSAFDPDTYEKLLEWASTAPVRSAMQLDDIDYHFNLKEHQAAFVFLVIALYLDN